MKRNIIFLGITVILICISVYLIEYSKKQEVSNSNPNTVNTDKSGEQDNGVNGDKQSTQKSVVVLYFLNKDTNALEQEKRELELKSLLNQSEAMIILELLKGPSAINLKRVIPEGTKLNKVVIQGDAAMVDFDEKFNQDNPDKDTLSNRIESIVKSLCELKQINKVQISVNGKTIN